MKNCVSLCEKNRIFALRKIFDTKHRPRKDEKKNTSLTKVFLSGLWQIRTVDLFRVKEAL